MRIKYVLHATTKDINEWVKRLKKCSTHGLDGIQKKHVVKLAIKEALRLLFKVTLVSSIQPSD